MLNQDLHAGADFPQGIPWPLDGFCMVLLPAVEHMAFLHRNMRARCQELPPILPQEDYAKNVNEFVNAPQDSASPLALMFSIRQEIT